MREISRILRLVVSISVTTTDVHPGSVRQKRNARLLPVDRLQKHNVVSQRKPYKTPEETTTSSDARHLAPGLR